MDEISSNKLHAISMSTRRVDEQEEEEEERPSSFVFVEGVVRINAML